MRIEDETKELVSKIYEVSGGSIHITARVDGWYLVDLAEHDEHGPFETLAGILDWYDEIERKWDEAMANKQREADEQGPYAGLRLPA